MSVVANIVKYLPELIEKLVSTAGNKVSWNDSLDIKCI